MQGQEQEEEYKKQPQEESSGLSNNFISFLDLFQKLRDLQNQPSPNPSHIEQLYLELDFLYKEGVQQEAVSITRDKERLFLRSKEMEDRYHQAIQELRHYKETNQDQSGGQMQSLSPSNYQSSCSNHSSCKGCYSFQQEVDKREHRIGSLLQELSTLKNQKKEMEETLYVIQNDKQSTKLQAARATSELYSTQNKVSELEVQLKELKDTFYLSMDVNTLKQKEASKLKNDLQKLEESHNHLVLKLDEINQSKLSFQEKEPARKKLKARIDLLEEQNRVLQAEMEELAVKNIELKQGRFSTTSSIHHHYNKNAHVSSGFMYGNEEGTPLQQEIEGLEDDNGSQNFNKIIFSHLGESQTSLISSNDKEKKEQVSFLKRTPDRVDESGEKGIRPFFRKSFTENKKMLKKNKLTQSSNLVPLIKKSTHKLTPGPILETSEVLEQTDHPLEDTKVSSFLEDTPRNRPPFSRGLLTVEQMQQLTIRPTSMNNNGSKGARAPPVLSPSVDMRCCSSQIGSRCALI